MTENRTDMPPSGGGTPRWLRVLLVLSLAVNLLIAGVVIGAIATRGGHPGPERIGAARDLGPMPFVMAFEPEERRALGRELAREGDRLRQNRSEMRARFEALLAALRADPFDPETVRGIVSEQRHLAVARQEIGERVLLEKLAAMTLEERRAYADRLDRSLRRGDR